MSSVASAAAQGNGVSRRGLKQAAAEPGSKETRVMPSGPSGHWTLLVLFLSLVVDLLGFTVILPLIPSMLEYYSHNDQVSRTVLFDWAGRLMIFFSLPNSLSPSNNDIGHTLLFPNRQGG